MTLPLAGETAFQPVLDLATGSAVGVMTTLQRSSPADGWVLERVCSDFLGLMAGMPGLVLTIDAGPASADLPALIQGLLAALRSTRLDPRLVVLEVSAFDAIGADHTVGRCLEQLTRTGVGVAIDDLGTGYDSLLFLRQFPVSVLSLPPAMVAAAVSAPAVAAACASTIKLAHDFGVLTVAAGVTTRAEYATLQLLGCDRAAGPLWGEPAAPAETHAALLANRLVVPGRGARSASDQREFEDLENGRPHRLPSCGRRFAVHDRGRPQPGPHRLREPRLERSVCRASTRHLLASWQLAHPARRGRSAAGADLPTLVALMQWGDRWTEPAGVEAAPP